MTKTILLMRHAKSSWKDTSLHDFDRPLKRRGVESAKRMAGVLLKNKLMPQLILTSPAKRARQTAELVADQIGFQGKVALVDSFYLAEPDDYLAELRQLSDEVEKVLLVGHNPGMQELCSQLEEGFGEMPPGSLACVVLDVAHWSELGRGAAGKYGGFWDPRRINFEDTEAEMGKDKDKKDKKDKKKDKKDKKKDKK